MTRLLPVAFGLLMVVAAAYCADGAALAAAAAAGVAVAVSAWIRPAGTAAVILVVATITLGGSTPMYTVLAGLAAAVYLVFCHGHPTVVTMAFTTGFASVAALVVVLPLQVPWLPLAAPLALLAAYLLALRPFLRAR